MALAMSSAMVMDVAETAVLRSPASRAACAFGLGCRLALGLSLESLSLALATLPLTAGTVTTGSGASCMSRAALNTLDCDNSA
eukprot:5937484-Pyramimonas_sp.AAC.1